MQKAEFCRTHFQWPNSVSPVLMKGDIPEMSQWTIQWLDSTGMLLYGNQLYANQLLVRLDVQLDDRRLDGIRVVLFPQCPQSQSIDTKFFVLADYGLPQIKPTGQAYIWPDGVDTKALMRAIHDWVKMYATRA